MLLYLLDLFSSKINSKSTAILRQHIDLVRLTCSAECAKLMIVIFELLWKDNDVYNFIYSSKPAGYLLSDPSALSSDWKIYTTKIRVMAIRILFHSFDVSAVGRIQVDCILLLFPRKRTSKVFSKIFSTSSCIIWHMYNMKE